MLPSSYDSDARPDDMKDIRELFGHEVVIFVRDGHRKQMAALWSITFTLIPHKRIYLQVG